MASCRLCQANDISVFLDLGRTPLANALLKAAELSRQEKTFPLQLALCSRCSLVQILESVAPEDLFSEYLYFSSFSTAMVQHAKILAERLVRDEKLTAGDLVVEIASNDGYLLQWYPKAGIQVLGIEPARNVAAVAIENKIPTLVEFFGGATARLIKERYQSARIIHANNVLAHVPQLNDVVNGMADLLAPQGLIVVEAPYVKPMIDNTEFDTIYHEHLFYFSLTALDRLFHNHGLIIEDVEVLPIHGGSLRIFARHGAVARRRDSVTRMLDDESEWVSNFAFYDRFSGQVETLRRELTTLLQTLRNQGKRICAYGAAAKGSTLLNSFGIDRSMLDFVVDRSPYKQGRFMPGVHLEIFSPEKLLTDRPDYVLLLPWNHAEEVLAQQEEYRRLGGKFIVPLPVPTVV